MPGSQLSRADLDVYYAQVLIYKGMTTEGINLLKQVITELEAGRQPEELARQDDPHAFEGWRRNLVLGRGHNNLGYAYWWVHKHCNLALKEFRAALPYFRASDLLEESANTTDLMGRVYTTLSQRVRAESLIEDSLALRLELGRDYRIALSYNSRAIAHLVFDEPDSARRLSEQALSIFERLGAQRGIGIASVTLGLAMRKLGTLSTASPYSLDEYDKFLRDAMTFLDRAVEILEGPIKEPVRLCAAYNELGCTYRERAALMRIGKSRPSLARGLVQKAVTWLEKSIQLAKTEKYMVAYVDACEDLAQVFFQHQEYKYSQQWLQEAESQIPDDYKLKPGIEPREIAVEDCVEEFWQILGKIELLRGFLAYDVGLIDEEQISHQVLEQAMEHFVLAYAYFERFSGQAAGLKNTLKQLYTRFKKRKYEDLRYMQDELLPQIAQAYFLDPTKLTRFFEDTLGLAALQSPD
jgi:tetratricopeptide (TPR) repeat protein